MVQQNLVDVIKFANKSGALTVGISNNINSELEKMQIYNNSKYWSRGCCWPTRLKAGTAQKICLNLISHLL